MWDAFLNAVTLFLKGKLFRDFNQVVKQTLIGNAVGAVLMIVLAKVGLPLYVVIPLVSIVAGALQPWLFKDLKYA
ncbi:MAG: hypothetical protein JST44_27825 [Cyanobacteria bacterium SZAS LIN-5]|nr:hypothetical protein [Cyanobacteria bacterium SZAS LIN-5]RTL39476.1 MAG: hypothetical protein EKK48_18865 [Candidatus Melainabacteria bacterium]